MAKFFRAQKDWRRWLEKNHDAQEELWVGFYKTSTKKPSITWKESVDEALCFGWIDGIRKSIDESSYQIRFTPRKAGSNWSAINIARVKELEKLGLMHEAGLATFAKRKDDRTAIYSYEQRKNPKLDPAHAKRLRANAKAWAFFSAQPAWYQRGAAWWIVSAKKEETKLRRLAQLIADSAAGRTIPPLTRPGKQIKTKKKA
jgi:uncharacterized protein YdeI (YjbR/CyaY-like superfamily)